MSEEKLGILVIIIAGILLLMVAFVITFFSIFQKRKTQLLIEKAEEKQKYERELAKSQMEIQEQTFKNISWELHDNIGQLLSVAKMQLNMLQATVDEERQKQVKETGEVVGKSLQEIRVLSKALNSDVIQSMGLSRAIGLELSRFNKLNFLIADIEIHGDEVMIDRKDEIIIFRILQEFFSNVIKHSKASELNVILDYTDEMLTINAKDNGVGFDRETVEAGSGLINMQSRAMLINADLTLKAQPNKGVSLTLSYPLLKQHES